jgi:hypothetical protein
LNYTRDFNDLSWCRIGGRSAGAAKGNPIPAGRSPFYVSRTGAASASTGMAIAASGVVRAASAEAPIPRLVTACRATRVSAADGAGSGQRMV